MAKDMSEERREEIRRAVDIENLITRTEFETLLGKVEENTALTKEVHEVLCGLKMMAHIAKWVTVIATMVAAIIVAIKHSVGIKP
jgi:hypothetical protein